MIRNETSVDLQQNVYQNLTEFIKISRETQKLKGEMRVLRNLMSELKDNVGALRSASASSAIETQSGTSKRDKRSSVLDRSQIWNSHLQEMWKSIAGSQKFLPAAPGRHVIQDAGNWLELDPATWKPRREMRIFLLNDHLLVASRKKPSAGDGERGAQQAGRERLVADRCWPLLDIEMVDLASTATASPSSRNNVTNAIMVRGVGHDSFTYQIENPSTNGKATLLLNFRKAAEELRKGLRLEIESSTKSKDTVNYFASRDPGMRKSAALLESISEIKDRPDMLIEVGGKQQNIRWVEGQIDELDIDIALQRFEEAVARVENLKGLAKGLKSNALAQDFINLKADERALKLADLINHELIATNHELSKTKRNVNWLSRLGFDNRARDSYLSARSQLIEKRFRFAFPSSLHLPPSIPWYAANRYHRRQCIFEGDFQQYIWEISFVYFTLIKNTVVAFKGCFPIVMMSACVQWARERVEELNSVLLGQLGEKKDGETRWVETMNQAREHARILGEVGLDFGHLIGRREMNAQVV